MIDKILVRKSDDVALILKSKVKTVELKKKYPQSQNTNVDEPDIKENIVCRHRNGGFCMHRSWCRYTHTLKVCESCLMDGKCSDEKCSSRHPKTCACCLLPNMVEPSCCLVSASTNPSAALA